MKLDTEYAQRKALMVAACDLQRLRLQRSLLALRAQAQPPAQHKAPAWSAPVAATLLSLALPQWGPQRLQRVLELAQWALQALRLWRAWQGARGAASASEPAPERGNGPS